VTDAQLQALVAVADSGSFTAAARRLGMSQSAVSHALAGLEEALGVTLVHRSARRVRLTDVGERTAAHAREVLRLKGVIKQEADAARRLRGGTVRVGSFGVSASRRLLPPIIEAFARRHPSIDVLVQEGSDPEVERWIADGTVDVGFVTLPNDGFDTLPIAEDEMRVVVPARHPLAESRARGVSPADVGRYPFIMPTAGCERLICDIMGDVRLDVRHRMREVDTIVAMVARGMGISIKPRLALPDVLPADVVALPLAPARTRRVALAVRRSADASPTARAFLRVAAQVRAAPNATPNAPDAAPDASPRDHLGATA
jgi:DNA-binding transcriptional LysR family regulator